MSSGIFKIAAEAAYREYKQKLILERHQERFPFAGTGPVFRFDNVGCGSADTDDIIFENFVKHLWKDLKKKGNAVVKGSEAVYNTVDQSLDKVSPLQNQDISKVDFFRQ